MEDSLAWTNFSGQNGKDTLMSIEGLLRAEETDASSTRLDLHIGEILELLITI